MKTLAFLSSKSEISERATAIFEQEAQKMNVAWTAVSVAPDNFDSGAKDASLIVALQVDGWSVQVPKTAKCASEVWKVDGADSIQQNISRMMVKLIMMGGQREPLAQPVPKPQPPTPKELAQAMVRVFLESKGRGGKKVTVITGIPLNDAALEDLTTKLKRTCGTGGTLKDGQIEIQGDHRSKLIEELQKLGYKPKKAGG
ncbi:MAG TPA: hypothetical protein V6C76_13420 [Drouetiella sp.]